MAPQKRSTDGKEAATFRIKSELLKKLKYIAMKDNTTQTNLIEGAVMGIVAKWEKKNGPIPIK